MKLFYPIGHQRSLGEDRCHPEEAESLALAGDSLRRICPELAEGTCFQMRSVFASQMSF